MALLVLQTVSLVGVVVQPLQASHASGCGEFVRRKACSPNSTAPGSQRKQLLQRSTLVQCTGACGAQNQSGCCEFDSFGSGDCAWMPQGTVVSGKPSHSATLCNPGPIPPPPPLPPPPPPAPGPPTATTSCVGCWNKASGQCQINSMTGTCIPAKPEDCAAIPAANGSNWVWSNTSMWSWSYGCLSRIRSEHCDMVAEFACPDDGKNDGHGEYLPRKGSPGVTVPGHTATPEACIAMARTLNYTWVQWNGECYDSAQPDGILSICKDEADPTRCAHCPTDECKEQCMEERFANHSSNCFAMNHFATGCVWPGPWCYYEVETARLTPKCGYEWVNPHVHPQKPHCQLNSSRLAQLVASATIDSMAR